MFWLEMLFGFLAGVIGGMGMGGGTVLVPLLSLIDLDQKIIQSVNLLSFIPMCIVALCFHKKNNLLETKHTGYLTIPAVFSAVGGAMLVSVADSALLKRIFAVFLIVVGTWQFVKGVASARLPCKQ